MRKFWCLGIAVAFTMLMTTACSSDDENIDPAVKSFVESFTYTEEELTGFEPLGIQGGWELPEYNATEGSGGSTKTKSVSLFFNDKGQVRVVASHDDAFFLPTGVYNYSYDAHKRMLTINGTQFLAYTGYGYLGIAYPYDTQSVYYELCRKANVQTAVPNFFDRYLGRENFNFPQGETDEWTYSLNVVDNQEELLKLYRGDVSLPHIDFNRYTLIFGSIDIATRSVRPESMELTEEDGQYTYHVNMGKSPIGLYTADGWTYYYWRLYPKLSSKDVNMLITATY